MKNREYYVYILRLNS